MCKLLEVFFLGQTQDSVHRARLGEHYERQHQKNEIDALAKTIEGADLLRDHPSVVWSCSRCSEFGGWIANGNLGFAHGNFLYVSGLSVPLVLYR